MLNNTKIKKLKPKDKLYRLIDSDGLYIEVKPNGRKFWRYNLRKPDGKYSLRSLGEFPGVLTEDARIARDELIGIGEYGDTKFSDVAEKWLDWKGYASEKNHELVKNRIENYFNPVLGNMNIAEIKPADVLKILKRVEKRGHLELARRLQQHLSGIFKYAVINLLCESNPAMAVSGATKAPKVKNHPAAKTEQDFIKVLHAVEAGDRGRAPAIKSALQLQAYIFVRSDEMRNIRPEDVNLDKRLLTIRKTKNQRELLVPLCESALAIVQDALEMTDGEYLFSGMRYRSMISENSLNKRLRQYGIEKDMHVFHGYRTSFSTLAREVLRLSGDLIELQLDHNTKGKVQAAYDKSERLEERVELMEKWGAYIDKLKPIH